MKFLKLAVVYISLFLGFESSYAQTKIVSYNIRYDSPNDGENRWDLRKDELVKLLEYYHPDFIGIQEAMPNQFKFIAQHIDNYKYLGHGRDGFDSNSEATPIFYDANKFKLLAKDLFWLSSTPQKVSKGWDAALNRIVVYAKFKATKTNEIIHIINTHFDHVGENARLNSAKLILNFIREKKLGNKKVVLMGDFNSLPSEPPIKILEQEFQNTYKENNIVVYGPKATFNGFNTSDLSIKQIDYIFTRNLEIKSYRCIDDRRTNNLHLSDHFPILVEIQ